MRDGGFRRTLPAVIDCLTVYLLLLMLVALLHAKAQRVMHSTEHVCFPIEVEGQESPCCCKVLRPPSVAGAQGSASDRSIAEVLWTSAQAPLRSL